MDKNIKLLAGKPLIFWSIETCLNSKLISKIYVSTDSLKYANIVKKYSSVNIILRPKNLSLDNSTDYEMIEHAIKKIDFDYEFIAHIRPTTPLRASADINIAIKKFIKSKYNSLRSIHEMSETAYKSVEIVNGQLKPLKNLNYDMDKINESRQKFKKTYRPNGLIDIYRKNFVIKQKLLFGKKVKAYKTSYCPEIDNIEDFKYIEFLCQKK